MNPKTLEFLKKHRTKSVEVTHLVDGETYLAYFANDEPNGRTRLRLGDVVTGEKRTTPPLTAMDTTLAEVDDDTSSSSDESEDTDNEKNKKVVVVDERQFERAGGYEYVKPFDNDYPCGICKLPPVKATQCIPCGAMFCELCAVEFCGDVCAACKATPFSALREPVTTKALLRTFAQTVVVCPQCSRHFARETLPAHVLEECPKKPVPCSVAGSLCSWHGTREQVRDHAAVCRLRAIAPQFNDLKQQVETLAAKIAGTIPSQFDDMKRQFASLTAKIVEMSQRLDDQRIQAEQEHTSPIQIQFPQHEGEENTDPPVLFD